MSNLREELLAAEVEGKMIGAGQQLLLWSREEEYKMRIKSYVERILSKSTIGTASFITLTFTIDGLIPSKYEQLSLPLDL